MTLTPPAVATTVPRLVRDPRWHDPRLRFWGATAAMAAGIAYLGAVDPNQPGHYPTCPLYALTGLYCPGCGALRTVHALAHADLGDALSKNPLLVVSVPLLVWFWARWGLEAHGRRTRRTLAPAWVIWAVLVIEVVYTVLRNVPAFAWLAPH